MSNLAVILLAGGSSSRFAPLKEKNLYKFLGKTPVEYQIDKIKKFIDHQKIIIITNSESFDRIVDFVKTIDKDIVVLKQLGDGQSGAVLTALGEIEDGSEVLAMNMNDFYDDYLFKNFQERRIELQKLIHSMLTGYRTEKYFPGGYLELNENKFIQKVIEKPGAGNEPSNFVRIVFDYFADSKIVKDYLKNAKSEKDDLYEVGLSDMMKSGINFEMLEYDGKWVTIKYPWHVLNVMDFFLSKIESQIISPNTHIAQSAKINGNVIIEDGVKIYDNAVINGPVFIGANSVIGNNSLIRNSMIGENCVIGFACEVAHSYFGSQVWLHKNYIGDSIIETNVSFGSNALTANLRLDENEICVNVKGEKINSQMRKLGSIIASNVRIGVNANIMPGVKIASNSVVGPGVIVSEDVENGIFVSIKQTIEKRENKVDLASIDREGFKKKL